MSEENEKQEVNATEEAQTLDIDESVLTPGTDVKADPFHAIMAVDEDGNTTGQLWGAGVRLMLFESLHAAKSVLKALDGLKGEEQQAYELRGVSAEHLQALQKLAENDVAELFVIVGINPQGDVEALPYEEYNASKSKAGLPPPVPGAK